VADTQGPSVALPALSGKARKDPRKTNGGTPFQ
jgi:hypothetical protein